VLEARDVLAVLGDQAGAPGDLREKALDLAGRVLEADPDLPAGSGRRRAEELLANGAARRKMDEIIAAQGPSPVDGRLGSLVHEVTAPHDGRVEAIDCLRIANIARLAGAPNDPGAGIDLLLKTGDIARAGEPLYRIHASEPSDFQFAVEAAGEASAVRVAS
jgi:thymidine phosphorylase